MNSKRCISFLYITVSLIFIFSIIRTLDYPDYLFKSQRVWIIEVRLYQVHGEDDPWQLGTEGRRRDNWRKTRNWPKKNFFLSGKKFWMFKKEKNQNPQEYQNPWSKPKRRKTRSKKVLLVQGKLRLCANLKGRKRHVRKSYTEKSLDILKYFF